MRRTLGWASLTIGCVALFSTDVGAQKKTKDAAEVATDQDYKQIQSYKDMTGKLASVNTMPVATGSVTTDSVATGSVTFRLDTPHMVPNPKFKPSSSNNNAQYHQMQKIYHDQAKVMATRDPIQRQIRMQQLMATMQGAAYQQMLHAAATNSNPAHQPFMLAHQYKDFDLELSDKVAVRKMILETEYDDKGNIKTYTQKEKNDLRGPDPNKPGYTAKLDDLGPGMQVKVYLKMPKKTKPASESDKAADKDQAADKDKVADKDKAVEKAADNVVAVADKAKNADDKGAAKEEVVRPIVTMIVILQSLDTPIGDVAPAKKKKDN